MSHLNNVGQRHNKTIESIMLISTPVVYRIRILESNLVGYSDFFGFGLDIVVLSTGFGSGLSK